MKAFKYFAITAILISGLSSCLVVRDRPGYYHSRPHYHHYHGHGYYR
ncbi:hypothetical protein [Chitinophaga ginsengisoli]|nr:hypothetical protein [Chitinophaga ginsengisoli]